MLVGTVPIHSRSGGPEGQEGQELGQSVEEAIREAMNTSLSPSSSNPPAMAVPQPHLPLRKSSVQALHQRRAAPRPLLATSKDNQLRGFNPLPVRAMPHIDNATASSEHAFAVRDMKRSSKLPLDVHALGLTPDNLSADAEWPLSNAGASDLSRPPSSPMSSPFPSPTAANLRPSKSVGDGLRGKRRSTTPRKTTPHTFDLDLNLSRPNISETHRASVRSGLTSSSSVLHTSSLHTDRSSQATGNSSPCDFVFVQPDSDCDEDEDLSVEDAIGMYENGFDSAKPSMEIQRVRSAAASPDRPSSSPAPNHNKPPRPSPLHRRSQSATAFLTWQTLTTPEPDAVPASDKRVDSRLVLPEAVPRDRYGFKKASHHISIEQYDAWNNGYIEYLERRTKKWNALMRSYGLNTDSPLRFPPKGDKIKRYVRKGIPPHLRGAAWFWYAGGPGQLAKNPGLYKRLLDLVEKNKLSELDREHIERDLNRTFPDNIRFKPDPVPGQEAAEQGRSRNRGSTEPETPMVRALRRVLQAFAVYNPQIGYCQSLNFIAGLLLLFLDQDEEKAFTLLNIVTSTHLPGTHGIALEGANIDIAVLMTCIKDSLPNVWTKLDDKGGSVLSSNDPSAQALRLPTVSLATTAWFMSLFVGTLPIESVLRVWDCLFFEGSKTLFRIALAIFKAGEKQILAVSDPMEIFQVVQTIPRSMLDINGLMDVCFRRRGGFGHVSQGLIEQRREDRRAAVRDGVATLAGEKSRWTRRWRSRTKA